LTLYLCLIKNRIYIAMWLCNYCETWPNTLDQTPENYTVENTSKVNLETESRIEE